MTRTFLVGLCVALAACGGSQRESTATSASETTTRESTGSSSGGEPRATSEPSEDAAAGRASATTPEAPADGPSADLVEYARRTMVIVRRHWMIPATLGPQEAAGLSSTISILIDETTRRVTGYRVVSESGNTIFDESVRRGLQALVDANELMPEPPVGLDDRASVRLRLTGR